MLPERFTKKFIVTEDGHWIWTASLQKSGYGQYGVDHTMVYAHRYCWEQLVGPIPDGMQVNHKNSCHRRDCVNPEHCYLGTQKQNVQDAKELGTFRPYPGTYNTVKTHCTQGHEYNEENTNIWEDDHGLFHRQCKICKRERALSWYYKNKDKK